MIRRYQSITPLVHCAIFKLERLKNSVLGLELRDRDPSIFRVCQKLQPQDSSRSRRLDPVPAPNIAHMLVDF